MPCLCLQAYYALPLISVTYRNQGLYDYPQVSLCWGAHTGRGDASVLGAMAGTFDARNPMAVQCSSANVTAVPIASPGLHGGAAYPGYTPYGGAPFAYTSAVYRTSPRSTCDTTQDLNAAAFYLCADAAACQGTVVDECLTFATNTPTDLATLGAPNANKTAVVSVSFQALVRPPRPTSLSTTAS